MIRSFNKDHTKLDVPYIEHYIHMELEEVDIVKVDLRLMEPNSEVMSTGEMHTIEHLLSLRLNQMYPESIIDVSPMGCRTGFYISYVKGRDKPIIKVKEALSSIKDIEMNPAPDLYNCGNYRDHDIEGAKRLLKKVDQLLNRNVEREYIID